MLSLHTKRNIKQQKLSNPTPVQDQSNWARFPPEGAAADKDKNNNGGKPAKNTGGNASNNNPPVYPKDAWSDVNLNTTRDSEDDIMNEIYQQNTQLKRRKKRKCKACCTIS